MSYATPWPSALYLNQSEHNASSQATSPSSRYDSSVGHRSAPALLRTSSIGGGDPARRVTTITRHCNEKPGYIFVHIRYDSYYEQLCCRGRESPVFIFLFIFFFSARDRASESHETAFTGLNSRINNFMHFRVHMNNYLNGSYEQQYEQLPKRPRYEQKYEQSSNTNKDMNSQLLPAV